MTNIEKIRAEIERLKHQAEEAKMEWVNEGYNQNAFAEDCRISSFDKLLAFIDTLSEEPDKSMEEAAAKHIRRVVDIVGHPGWDWTTQDITEAFIAGAKWDAKHLRDTTKMIEPDKCENIPKDLKEAAEDFVWEVMENDEDGISDLCRKLRPTSKISDYYDALAEFFKAGAKWQKSQMLKDAVEGEVYLYHSYNRDATAILVDIPKENLGDKVRIVVLKAEEE